MKQLSSHAAAAAAIRAELKAEFPAVKFSVTSESFSMGNAVRIHWTDGPSDQVIDAIVGKYEYGHFNPMEDIYEYSNRRDDIPQAKYVSTTRKLSIGLVREVAEKLAAFWNREIVINETSFGGWQVGDGLGPDVREIEEMIYRELRERGEKELEEFEAKRKEADPQPPEPEEPPPEKKEMKYEDLDDSNKVDEGTVPDGYNGHTAKISLHVVNGESWIRTKNGCFRAPEGGLERFGWIPAPQKIPSVSNLDIGAGAAKECRLLCFSPAEERGLSALADYYDGIGRRTL